MEDDPSRARGRRRPSGSTVTPEYIHPPAPTSSLRRVAEDRSPSDEQPLPKIIKREEGPVASISRCDRQPRDGRDDRGGARARDRYEIVHTRGDNLKTKCGELGKPIVLQTNFFRLLTKPTWKIFQYHVDFSPEIELRRVRGGILSEHKSILGGYLYDGIKIFTTTKLPDDKLQLESKSRTGEMYKITMKFVGIISMTEWQSLQVLNLILRRAMEGLKLQLVGRNFFDPLAKIDIREFRIQLWPGYITSIRQHERDILVGCEIAHKVMRTETVYDILMRCTQESREYQESFKRQVLGLVVLTDYTNKTYRIDDVDFSQSPRSTFNMKGKDTSYVEYYRDKYHIRIRDEKQPLLLSKAKDREKRVGSPDFVYLVPELCRSTGLTDAMRANFQLTRAMAEHTGMNPGRRIERLKGFNRRLQETDSSVNVLNDWNMKLDRNLVEVKGRVIEPQKIVFFNRTKIEAGTDADWSRAFRDNALFETTERGLDNWVVITPGRQANDCNNFVQSLIRAAGGMRFNIRNPRLITLYDDRNSSYMGAIDNASQQDPQLILCLVPNNNTDRYSTIKKKTCVERAIPTQVITARTAGNRKGLMSIATKVAIQINCKLGYAPWNIELPGNLVGLMTIGYDISKSSKNKSKAYGAMVATMDLKTNARFYSTVSECHGADQLSNELTISVVKALRQYQNEHRSLPNRILLYRDGVGEGSLNQVMEHEVKPLVERLEKIYAGENIPLKFAFIVVSKSINTRFFHHDRNPPPGTVVDDVVTLPERYDFFLVSQSVRQGTVSPTCYNVVHSTFGLRPDYMQILTYKMTHLYYNWAGTTRVPAVCQYAKKLATLVSQSVHHIPSTSLEKRLYYL